MSVAIELSRLITEKLTEIQNVLRQKGVSDEIIEEAFGCVTDDEPVTPLPSRRMLNRNDSQIAEPPTKNEPVRANCVAQNASEKLPQNWVGKSDVVLVLNYTDKSHALFGDFAKTYASFRNDFLKQQNWLIYNQSLAFGAGWVVKDKSKVSDLRKALKNNQITFREVEKSDFVNELKKPATVAETSESTESENPKLDKVKPVKSKPAEKVESTHVQKSKNKEPEITKPKGKSEPPKKVESESSSKIKKNKWGNFADENTGLIFKKLPVGEKGKQVTVIIGYQKPDPEGDATGMETVLPLTIDHLEEASRKHSCPTLNQDIIKKVRKVDKDLADQLQEIMHRTLDEVDGDELEADDDELDDDDDDELDDEDDQ